MENRRYETIMDYINENPLAVVGTVNADGSPHGAVVHVCTDDHRPVIYFLTKEDTRKYHNLSDRPLVSVTIVNQKNNSTLQAVGRAFTAHDAATIDMVTKKINRAHSLTTEWLPPIAKLRAGAYIIVGIEIANARLAEFQGAQIGDEHIFTQTNA